MTGAPLTAEEIAELREAARQHFWADGPIEPESTNVLRLLDEVERTRNLLIDATKVVAMLGPSPLLDELRSVTDDLPRLPRAGTGNPTRFGTPGCAGRSNE